MFRSALRFSILAEPTQYHLTLSGAFWMCNHDFRRVMTITWMGPLMSLAPLPYRIEITDKPAPHERDMLAAPLLAYNEVLLGAPGIHPVAALIRTQDDARVLGGLWGRTSFQWLFVELLFVPGSLRGQGLGTQLLAAAENEARARGCLGAWLDTFSPDACRFYKQRGYRLFGVIADYPAGNTRSFLSKRFPAQARPLEDF